MERKEKGDVHLEQSKYGLLFSEQINPLTFWRLASEKGGGGKRRKKDSAPGTVGVKKAKGLDLSSHVRYRRGQGKRQSRAFQRQKSDNHRSKVGCQP